MICSVVIIIVISILKISSGKEFNIPLVGAKNVIDDLSNMILNDMKFTPEQETTMKFKNAFVRTQKWPNGIVPYTMNPTIANDPSRKSAIENAIRVYSEKTCIRWVPRSNEQNYLEFFDGGARQCYSMVGLLNEGKQQISIGKGCENAIAIVIHEMMHTAGFMHEHMRPDRDNYITLVNSKIIPEMLSQFTKLYASDADQQNLAYDYSSVMHYPSNAFSVDGSNTIITKDPSAQSRIGQKMGFSKCDLEKLNKWYGCTSKLTNDPSCAMGAGPEQPVINTPPTEETSTLFPPTGEPPTNNPIIGTCSDNNSYQCGMMQHSCYIYPGYYLTECKKTCDNCDGTKCADTSMYWYQNICRSVRRNNCIYYMQRILCPKSCGLC